MKKNQPEISAKLELYQDKCADVLATVFIDRKEPTLDTKPLIDAVSTMLNAITTLTENMSMMQNDINALKESTAKRLPEKRYSRWKSNTFTKLAVLQAHVNEQANENLTLSQIIHLVISETEDTYSIEINDYIDNYKMEYSLDVKPYTIDVIGYYKDVKDMFTLTLDSIMERLSVENPIANGHIRNIFDELSAKTMNKHDKDTDKGLVAKNSNLKLV